MRRVIGFAVGFALALVIGCLASVSALAANGFLRTSAGELQQGAALHMQSSNLELSTPAGSVECASAEFAGSFETNARSTADIIITEAKTGGCHFGASPATLTFEHFSWVGDLTSKGTFAIKSLVGAQVEIPAAGLDCAGNTNKGMSGSFSVSGPVAPLFAGQIVNLASNGAGECPPQATLGGTFSLTSGGETVEAGASQAGAPGTGTAEGTVTASGTPLAAVSVSVCEEEEPVTCYGATTNGSGHYSVSGLPEGEFTAHATPPAHDGYAATSSEEFEVTEGMATTADIALLQDGSLSGVVKGEGGAPVANVSVEACGSLEFVCFTTETEAGGHYSFTELPEGEYVETVTPPAHSGYAVSEGAKITVNGAQNTTEDITLAEVGAISGTVTGTGNAGVANVTVIACGPQGCRSDTTNGAGEYSIAETVDGSYSVSAHPPAHEGYATTTGPNTVVTGRADAIADIALGEDGEVKGTVTAVNHTVVVGAYAELCNVNYACYTAVTNSAGEYLVEEVAEGTYVVEVFPPPGYDEGSSPQFAVAAHGHVTENVVVNSPIPPPSGTVVSGISEIEIGGVKLPEIQWSQSSPITTKACVGGSVTATVTAVHVGTQTLEVTGPVTLTETPASSGTYDGSIPPVVPKHGEGKIVLKVTGCPNSGEDGETEFTIYIDPSGTVVDANNGNAPVAGANVILKSAEAEAGPYTAVPNGSAVMSPANRTNPGVTNAKGEFGWDTLAGFYEVEASKEGCGSALTPAFAVPPPQTNLELRLHCLLKVETSSLPKAEVGSPYDATLTASGGFTAYKWKKTAKLPKGLKLGKTGVISGTPSKKVVPGFYTVGVEVKDAKKHTATASLTLHIS